MGSEDTALKLQPDGLYVVLSQAQTKLDDAQQADGSTSINTSHGDRFEWGLYWSKSHGVGQSYRYRERNGDWQFERRGFPSASPNQIPIESNERVVLALHIENMHQRMASLLEDRLGSRCFQHSHPFRPRSRSECNEKPNTPDCEELDERGRKWLGHALVLLNDMGFISLKEGTRSAALIEGEAMAGATKNVASTPMERTVERSQNVIFDGKGLDGTPN